MIAALTLLCLLALSMIVVRVGSTALRLTGMSQTTARFQALSAFSGTGFTTSEAEEIMRVPARRKILVLLMVTGSLGVVTVLSTVILGLLQSDSGSEMPTIFYMLLAVLMICFLAVSARLDKTMCALIEKGLLRLGWNGATSQVVIAELPSGDELVEHTYCGTAAVSLDDIMVAFPNITILQVNGDAAGTNPRISSQDRLLCFAHFAVQKDLSDWLQNL